MLIVLFINPILPSGSFIPTQLINNHARLYQMYILAPLDSFFHSTPSSNNKAPPLNYARQQSKASTKIMKLLTSLLAASTQASICTAARLFVSSYDGYITTLDVVNGSNGLSLAWLNATDGCAPRPSWLELDSKTNTLYCTDEGATDQSTVSSYKIEQDGSLTQHSKITTPAGGVSSTVYNNGSALAIAH